MSITLANILALNANLTVLTTNKYVGAMSSSYAELQFYSDQREFQRITFYQSENFTVEFIKKTQTIEMWTISYYRLVGKDYCKELKILQNIITNASKSELQNADETVFENRMEKWSD